MSSSMLKKVGLVVLVLVAFVIFLKVNDYKTKHFKVNAKTFHVEASKDALLKDEFQIMPLLAPANQYHIMMNENVEVPLIDQRRTLHIEKAWLQDNSLYVLYSVDLRHSDQTFADVPKLSFSKIQLHFNNGKTVTVSKDESEPSPTPFSRYTYNYKVYDEMFFGFQLTPQEKINPTNFQAYLDNLKKIDQITLLNPTIELKGHKTDINPITFPAKLNINKYYVGSDPINKKLTVNGTTIQFNKVKKYYDHKEIAYKVTKNQNHIVGMEVNLDTGGTGDLTMPDTYSSDLDVGSTSLYVMDSQRVQLTPTKVRYKLNQSIKFNVSPKVFKQLYTSNKEVKVADVLNGQIYFGFDRSNGPNSFFLGFKKVLNKEPELASPSFVPKDTNFPKDIIDHSTLLSFKTSNGSPINWDASGGSSLIESNGDTEVFFNMTTMGKLDQGFSVELNGLVYEESVKGPTLTISLK